jgi:GT2 family glycosyltransferase/DNA-binding beta-propeller fold protein YncE
MLAAYNSGSVKTTVRVHKASGQARAASDAVRVATDGKFLRAGQDRFLVKGVTYGTFAPDADGYQFPALSQVAEDFRLMAALGLNTVRVYTPPRRDLLDEAARHNLRVMVGLPWVQHIAFLDDLATGRRIRRDVCRVVRELGDHPAVFLCALGNEVPPGVVRWHGRLRVERFLRQLYEDAKTAAPETLFTYVNFPPTEFLDLSFFDVCAFNVYLHREGDLRAYLAHLQHIAGQRPLLLAEAGADSFREGEDGQAAVTSTHIRVAFEEGACGAVAFAWTDEWWRGGHPVEEWAFGLVDRERRLKPAATAVAAAFADAPFTPEARRTWPRVSVVVCAYNAAETIDECLTALDRQSYPDYEVLVVNDGSRDETSAIARQHVKVRVIDTPNAGLSAARNVGLAAATGDIVAYTDADTRADRDWLTFLVQPFLTSEVVGSGGPNLVPADDPPMAQSIARAPGGPTHVLLDDRIAEHVPGCNMAFRRGALLAIGGFNPTYLRAGDDVDVCWRLQAQGWRLGFSAAALVWHHHRTSVRAYWRQQVGYGEGERWLMAHHPDKFLGGRALWQGRIYSPLPFVRSLWGEKINAGVWGTAAFPSVYRRDVHPFAFLPHSVHWQILSILLILGGLVTVAIGDHPWAAALLLGTGGIGLLTTFAKNVSYALRSDVDRVPGSRFTCRARVAWLHLLQPFARAVGHLRGALSPPEVTRSALAGPPHRATRPSLAEASRAMLLVTGGVFEDRYWSETLTTAERVLTSLVDWLRRSRAVRVIEIDEGWSADRDVSVLVGRWAWLDVRALVEDHGAGRSLLRVSTHLRPTLYGGVNALLLASALFAAASAGLALRWPTAGAAAAIFALAAAIFTAYRTSQGVAAIRRGIDAVALKSGLVAVGSTRTRAPLMVPALVRTYGLRSTAVFLAIVLALGAGTFMLREAAGAMVIGEQKGYAGDDGPAIQAWLDTPGGLAVTSNGDVYFADSNNHVIRRIDPANVITTVAGNHGLGWGFRGDYGQARDAQLNAPSDVAIAPDGDLLIADAHNHRVRRVDRETGTIMTIAGSGEEGYSGDGGPATEAALRMPSAVAVAQNGDVYIADTLNYRVRMIDHATGFIHTIAGRGVPRDSEDVGDHGPATDAWLNMPSDVAVAPSGDLYIADMHHQRVRLVDARSRLITTVAGSGRWGHSGDDGPATAATLAGPAGIAVVPDNRGGVTIFIADYYNGRVRAVGPDGLIHDIADGGRTAFVAPTRVAFVADRGWLYVTDSSRDQLIVLNIARLAPDLLPRPPSAPVPVARLAP